MRRPWAGLIMAGDKPTENRTWSTDYRGLLVIHAGRQVAHRWRNHLPPGVPVPTPSREPTGFLGTVTLEAVHFAGGLCGCGPWGLPDCYHWVLTDPQPFTRPVAGPGRLGLFPVSHDMTDITERITL